MDHTMKDNIWIMRGMETELCTMPMVIFMKVPGTQIREQAEGN